MYCFSLVTLIFSVFPKVSLRKLRDWINFQELNHKTGNMKKFALFLTLAVGCFIIDAQIPQALNYQAIARGPDGKEIVNTTIGVRLSILSDTTGFYGSGTGTYIWEEEQSVKTNSLGLFTLTFGNPLATKIQGSASSFSLIDWKVQQLFIGIKINNGGWKNMGTAPLGTVPYSMVAGELDGAVNRLEVIGEDLLSDESLFEVKRKDGQTIFAVYNHGVRVYMPLDTLSKGRKGGFAIGGFNKAKGIVQDYFVVNPDSIRLYIDNNSGKGRKGGFAIGGFSKLKSPDYDYMSINSDSTNFYIRTLTPEKSSTFNIIGIDQNQVRSSLLSANTDTISLAGVLQIQYNIMVTTAEVSLVTLASANSGGNVVSDGNATVAARGICWSTTPNPTTDDAKTDDGPGIGSFASILTGLMPGTTYHVRAYATNADGTAYGADVSFTTATAPVVPALTTIPVFPVGTTTAISGGNIISDGGAPITARGVCWSTVSNPTISDTKTDDGTGTGSFASSITGLTPATNYHIRSYATNPAGTAYGSDVSFTTETCIIVITVPISSITTSSASSGGNITSNCGATITDRGVCRSLTPGPTIADNVITGGSGTGSFTCNMTGLSTGTIYYLRAYATTGTGTNYGSQMSFVTNSTFTDYDGNVYPVVRIGTQIWMQENLKTVNLNDGSPIVHVTDGTIWANYTTPALCYYNNDEATYKNSYGALYNWYAVNSGKLCPTGWHVPSQDEFITLFNYLGGEEVAGFKLKEAGTSHWTSPNQASNESGFTALPGGMCYVTSGDRRFQSIGGFGYWWTVTPVPASSFIYLLALYNYGSNGIATQMMEKGNGTSVRCLKDQ
jgi:uncharacterized protein (TIGR02145 family)